MSYPTNSELTVTESRTIMPAWTARDLEQVDWYYLPLNPQENTCIPFHNNISTRIIEKNNYVPSIPCLSNNQDLLPVSVGQMKMK
jgi:hypothetical protein